MQILNNAIRMRDDLADDGLAVPASKSFINYDTQVDVTYITAEELIGATYGDDPAHPDDHPFCYVQLRDGRSLYFLSVDLDFGDDTGADLDKIIVLIWKAYKNDIVNAGDWFFNLDNFTLNYVENQGFYDVIAYRAPNNQTDWSDFATRMTIKP
jgi:hypothetical protein